MSYTAHMLEHVVLSQLVPLVLLAARRTLATRLAPALAWTLGVGAMVAASMPVAYAASDRSWIAWTIRLALVAAGIAFWSPVVTGGLRPARALAYLVTACFATTLAGAYIAFTATTSDQQMAGLIMWVPCCVVFLSAALVVVGRILARPAGDGVAS